MYVRCLRSGLEQYFKKANGIQKIDDVWKSRYEECQLEFCKSVVMAIKYGNKFVALLKFAGVAKDFLEFYTVPVDVYMTVFYNALIGH